MSIDKNIKKIINKIKGRKFTRTENIREISYDKLKNLIKENGNITIVDVRSPQEYREGKIRNAVNIPLYELNRNAETILKNKNSLIILYCACGARSSKAYQILEEKGYTNLYTLKGGLDSI